jgi:hypothetical protein
MIRKERLPIVIFAMFCLLAGLWSGLTRIGWNTALIPITPHHGAIMVGGFLGTLITLEKIIPLKRKILLLIPAFNALSVVFFFCGQPKVSFYILVVSSASLVIVFLHYFRIQRSSIYFLMMTGAMCWLTGNILLLTKLFYPLAFPWWTAFALFIIAAERLELMKFLPVTKANKNMLVILLLTFIVGTLFSFHGTGNLICGLSLVGASLWLMRNDVIALNMKKSGLPVFVAFSLFAGYTALLLTGVFFFSLSDQWLTYDAVVHAFFLGFVFSMIFAHGPIILPGILGIAITPFSKILYLWLVLLQTSWLVRVFADVFLAVETRKLSGALSAISILGYFVTMVIITLRSQKYVKAF